MMEFQANSYLPWNPTDLKEQAESITLDAENSRLTEEEE